MISDFALELLDGLVEMRVVDAMSAASSSDVSNALDIGDIDVFTGALRELLERDLVRRRMPQSIRDSVGYYVNLPAFNRLLRELDSEGAEDPSDTSEPDWAEIRRQIVEFENSLQQSSLGQEERAQAGALISSLKILVEAPAPPKATIRNLLYDLAAIATIFALALQIAEALK